MLPLDFSRNNILVNECIFKLTFHCGSCRYQRFVVRKRHTWNIFEKVVTVAYQISLEINSVEVSLLVKLHD